MTTDLEQEFYDTFGIEPKYIEGENLMEYSYGKLEYPEITDHKLLEMICILNEHYCNNYQCATMLVGDTVEKIKECVLKDCIEQSQHIKSEMKQLFDIEEINK